MTKVKAEPTKEFFVEMITRDISLEDCILDLIDNSIDSARRSEINGNMPWGSYKIRLNLNENEFAISDNCGGMSLDAAVNYAFHFGRKKDAPSDSPYSIGLYGIGMKRAIFKIGRSILVESSTEAEAFKIGIDVDSWLTHQDWDFDLDSLEVRPEQGVSIRIKRLNALISKEFSTESFTNNLIKIIARDYARFLNNGLNIEINDIPIKPYAFNVLQGGGFNPSRIEYEDEDIKVTITAGVSALPPTEDSDKKQRYSDVEYYGWFVSCNDRVVLAGDKTTQTVWGHDRFPVWHPHYNGFIGFANFVSTNPNKLPWDTTKRSIDPGSDVYKRAQTKMQEASRPWMEYLKKRADLKQITESESSTSISPIFSATISPTVNLPSFKRSEEFTSIQFSKLKKEVESAKSAAGNSRMSNRDIGSYAFDYFHKNEVGE